RTQLVARPGRRRGAAPDLSRRPHLRVAHYIGRPQPLPQRPEPALSLVKFLHPLPPARRATSNRKAAPEPYPCECPLACEVRVRGCCHVSRTSEAGHW